MINPNDLSDIACDKCGDLRFESVFIIKKIPQFLSETGKEQIAPIPTFACLACGHVNAMFLPPKVEPAVAIDDTTASGTTSPTPKLTLIR